MARTQATSQVEGSGLGAPPLPRDYNGPNTLRRTGTKAIDLDFFHSRLPDATVMTIQEFRKLIRRIGKFEATSAKSDIAAVECGLYSLGGIVYKEWNKEGAQSVIKNTPPDSRTRMSDRRKEYTHLQDVQGNFVVVERSKADSFRRQVALQQLALDERAAAKEAERIRLLKASIT
jgi:hypothetical protein